MAVQHTDAVDGLVGRRRELETIRRLLGRTSEGGRALLLEGDLGIGKTRLLEESLRMAEEDYGLRAMCGHCYPTPEGGAYLPFHQILRQLSRGRGASDGAPEWPWHLPARMDRSGPDGPWRRTHLVHQISDSIARAAIRSQTLICVEDLQWADRGSLLVLNNLLDLNLENLVLVGTWCPSEEMTQEARHLLTRIQRRARRLRLKGLRPVEINTLVDNVVGVGHLTRNEIEQIYSFSGGNPLFICEFLTHLQETGLLTDHSLGEALTRSGVPDGLVHLVDMRLRSLPSQVKDVLSQCSAHEGTLSANQVALATGTSPQSTEELLQIAIACGVLKTTTEYGDRRYKFAHQLFSMRLYEAQEPGARRKLHRRLAESLSSDGLTAAEMARHRALGYATEDWRTTMRYCVAAAEEAESIGAFEEAARIWDLALRCIPPRLRRVRAGLFRNLGQSLKDAGNWKRASEAWREGVRLFKSIGRAQDEAQLALELGELCRWQQNLAEAELWLRRAIKGLPPDSQSWAKALALLGSVFSLRSDPKRGLLLLRRAYDSTGATDRDPDVAYWLSFGFVVAGDHDEARRVAEDGFLLAEKQGAELAHLARSMLAHELSSLRLPEARRYLETVERAIDPADITTLIRALICGALVWGYEGRWRQVARSCEQWAAEVRLAGPFQVATARMIWGEAQLALGKPAAARSEMLRALPNLQEMKPTAAMHIARCSLEMGLEREARDMVHGFRRELMARTSVGGQVVLGDVASRIGEPDLWEDCYERIAQEGRPMVLVYCPISVQRVLGRLAARLGMWSLAFQHFDTAVQQLAKGEAVWELARTYQDHAEVRRARRRRGDLTKAAALEQKAASLLKGLRIPPNTTAKPSAAADGNLFGLTGRELEVLTLAAQGRRSKEIGATLHLSTGTVNRHMENILAKVGASNRTEAVVRAMQEGIIGPFPFSFSPAAGNP